MFPYWENLSSTYWCLLPPPHLPCEDLCPPAPLASSEFPAVGLPDNPDGFLPMSVPAFRRVSDAVIWMMQTESTAQHSLSFLVWCLNRGRTEAMHFLDVFFKNKGRFWVIILMGECSTQWTAEVKVKSAGGVEHLPGFPGHSNADRSNCRAAEGIWTPEKALLTWRNTFLFQIRNHVYSLTLVLCILALLLSVWSGEAHSWCACGAGCVLRLPETQILSSGSPLSWGKIWM